MGSDGDVRFADGIEAHLFLREELVDMAVHGLVRTISPGRMGISEVEIGIKVLGDLLVLGELPAVVGGHRMDAICNIRELKPLSLVPPDRGFVRSPK